MASYDVCANLKRTLPFQYKAANPETARRVAEYLITKFGHNESEVAVDGLRVLYKTEIIGVNAERLRGYLDGLNDALCGVD